MKKPKTASGTAGVVLDSGAFIALEKGDPLMTHFVDRFTRETTPLDEVVFAQPGDLQLLGSRALEGLNFQSSREARHSSQ